MDTNINIKSPMSVAKGLGVFALLLAGTVLLVQGVAYVIDSFILPGKGYGAMLKKPFQLS